MNRWRLVALLGGLALAVPAVGMSAEPERGATIFKAQCGACHAVGPVAGFQVGPNLKGLVGRRVASMAGYAYSPALKGLPGAWDAKRLDTFLTAPGKMAPGTSMVIAVANPKDRADLIGYLKTAK